MSESTPCVTQKDTLEKALHQMEEHGYERAITLVNEHRKPIGYVSKGVAKTTKGYCGEHYFGLKGLAHANDDLHTITSLMFSHDTTWLPCVDDNGRFIGSITQSGITHHLGAKNKSDGNSQKLQTLKSA